jgi:hypothetical protein
VFRVPARTDFEEPRSQKRNLGRPLKVWRWQVYFADDFVTNTVTACVLQKHGRSRR